MLRIKEKRREKGLTIPQLSKMTGINNITIREAEMRGDCKLSVAQRIADALDIPLKELWDDTEEEDADIEDYEKIQNEDDDDEEGKKSKKSSREVITVYRITNYRGYDRVYSLEPLRASGSKVHPELYYLPKGYTGIYSSGDCKAVKTGTGEIVKFFMAKSDTPAFSLADGSMVFLERVEDSQS